MDTCLLSRRAFVRTAVGFAVAPKLMAFGAEPLALKSGRPDMTKRCFQSPAVEEQIQRIKSQIADAQLAWTFENCYPNTLDTTVRTTTVDAKPDTYVVTGDIDAMWLRDSSAQVWPYLPLIGQDAALERLIAGVVRRQARMILIDPYANAFMHSEQDKPLDWAVHDETEMKAGVGERKWEIDSLCYVMRLAHGYWERVGSSRNVSDVFDKNWHAAAHKVVATFREQQRKDGDGPYKFQRTSDSATESLPGHGLGNPTRAVGLIHSGFRPSDDACQYPFLIPSNLFASMVLRQMVQMVRALYADEVLAKECIALASEVDHALGEYGTVEHKQFGRMWAYEVDGYGNALMMDDSNAPGLLSLAYLGCCNLKDPLYQASRAFALSEANPWYFKGTVGEGIGGPHVGRDYIWPMSITMRALTSTDEKEIAQCLITLRNTTAGTGFMHESFHRNNPSDFTRSWFAWANTLFGELIVKLAQERPHLLRVKY